MDARQRWQALQSRLTAAHTWLERGDRDRALAEVDAALAIDPSFLAAAALRERILGSGVQGTGVQGSNPTNPTNPEPETLNSLPARPLPNRVSTEGYAKFEQRARRRRVDRRIDAARHAMAQRNLRAAAAALDEVIELDPNLPELSQLTATFDELRRARATSHRGPTIAAAAAFGVVLLGASWIHDGRALLSHPFGTIAQLVDARSPDPFDLPAVDASSVAEAAEPVATVGRREPPPPPPAVERPVLRTAIAPAILPPSDPPSAPPPASPSVAPAASPSSTAAAPVPIVAVTPAPAPVVVASAPAPIDFPKPSMPPPSRTETDEVQIMRALQQYRSAYEGLDAKRAQAVWPAVNEVALARAFGNLQSQTLTFDSCRTQLHGEDAVATCRGTTRYVPKIGSRDPRVEPRTWTFVMRKSGTDWRIESARAER